MLPRLRPVAVLFCQALSDSSVPPLAPPVQLCAFPWARTPLASLTPEGATGRSEMMLVLISATAAKSDLA